MGFIDINSKSIAIVPVTFFFFLPATKNLSAYIIHCTFVYPKANARCAAAFVRSTTGPSHHIPRPLFRTCTVVCGLRNLPQ